MNKALLPVFLGLAVCVFLEAQTFDEAISRAAAGISADLPANAETAVIHFGSGSPALNDYVINRLHSALVRNRWVTPVKPDESQLHSIRDGLRFNEAGEMERASARSIGQMLGARYLVTGALERTGSGYGILFTAVDVESAEQKSRYSAAVNPNNTTFISLLGDAPFSSTAGTLEILTLTAGTAEITGADVHQTAEIPAGSSLRVGEFNAGTYRVVMNYADGSAEEKTAEIKAAQAAKLEFSYRNIIGSLEIFALTAGTVEITGADVHQTAEIPAGSSLPVGEFTEGSYRAVIRYENGKTESKKVTIKPEQAAKLKFNYRPPERLNTVGLSVGATLSAPVFTGAVQGTIAPWRGSFFDLGAEIGLGSGQPDIEYISLYPFAHYALFVPFAKGGGWYAGAGAGVMFASFTFPTAGKITGMNVAADISTGFIFRNGITLSYTLRSDFATVNSKFAAGWSYRFKERR